MDLERGCGADRKIARKHVRIVQVDPPAESWHDWPRLLRVSDYESRYSEGGEQLVDLRRALFIGPLGKPTEPQWTIGVNADPSAKTEKTFQEFLSIRIFEVRIF